MSAAGHGLSSASLRGVAAVLCDLDGTLLDTLPDLAPATNAVREAFGLPPLGFARIAAFVGRGVDVLLQRALTDDIEGRVAKTDLARARSLFSAAYAELNGQRASVYPGVREGLATLAAAGVRLACVTNKPEQPARSLLARFDLERCFGALVGGDTLTQRKPEPEPLLHAARLLEVEPGACLMLGDSENDADAARAAGMRLVLVDYGYHADRKPETLGSDAIVSSLADLPALLTRP